jgi:hypothetical protein
MPRPPSKKSTPLDVYKNIIDLLVKETVHVGAARHVARGKYLGNAPESPEAVFIKSLSSKQRKLLAKMMFAERTSAVGDVLSNLSWYIDCHEVGLTHRGQPMPTSVWGGGPHFDYQRRLDGDEWPRS